MIFPKILFYFIICHKQWVILSLRNGKKSQKTLFYNRFKMTVQLIYITSEKNIESHFVHNFFIEK